ncbi:toll/interleukin-1 receptor domain-containing protein [Actinophytocola sp.]|uniref:toll/interleukin-1 receptor domain-containing protein n=1 Tax=Actinophytocola sp. TaxID=1872138 RepID=UPI002ED41F38
MSSPSVFLSFAGADRPTAETFRKHLRARDVVAFLDERDIAPGQNIVSTINDAISEADWFVLLWSHHTSTNHFATAEWTSAFMRGVGKPRPFLIVVTLDKSTLPVMLQASSFVQFEGDWSVVVDRLLATWRRDRREDPPCGVDIHVHNEALAVTYVVTVPPEITGRGLMDAVRAELGLKNQVAAFGGQVGARFFYRLEYDGRPLPDNTPLPVPLAEPGQVVDLVVRTEWFGPQWTGGADEYRHESGVLNGSMKRRLVHEAFGHLKSEMGAK